MKYFTIQTVGYPAGERQYESFIKEVVVVSHPGYTEAEFRQFCLMADENMQYTAMMIAERLQSRYGFTIAPSYVRHT